MSYPLRNDPPEELTTADLARGKRPGKVEEMKSQSVLSNTESGRDTPADINTPETEQEVAQTEVTAQLFPNNELADFRTRWDDIQTAFVDEPRRAVEQADGLVASAMKRLAEVFANERSGLEKQWDSGDNVSTEDLRIAFTRYRSFFQRLLSV
ncbi:MAG TPA: hypothetical protein VIW67_05225 [Terriglobales bacterium]|jgi:hypothetical protein